MKIELIKLIFDFLTAIAWPLSLLICCLIIKRELNKNKKENKIER